MGDQNCVVCLSRFRQPLSFPCGHTYCADCIESLVTVRPSDTGRVRDRYVSCPECREHFKVSQSRTNVALTRVLGNGSAASKDPKIRISRSQYPAANDADEELDERSACELVKRLRFPIGLARTVIKKEKNTGMRVFILDNSASTYAPDGSVTETISETPLILKKKIMRRWDEIKDAAIRQASYAFTINVPTVFHILNPIHHPPREGVDYCRIYRPLGSHEQQLEDLKEMLSRHAPRGSTPLARSLNEVYHSIDREKEVFLENGQQVFVCMMTDGKPNEKTAMVLQMRRLVSQLPVSIIIRLCTDEEDVMDFYNNLDGEEEIALDVIDDWQSEAKEIWDAGNRWLTYSRALHLIREAGIAIRLFDILDEKRFRPLQIAEFISYLIRPAAGHGPIPNHEDKQHFCDIVRPLVDAEQSSWDPLLNKDTQIIKIKEVKNVLDRGDRNPYFWEETNFNILQMSMRLRITCMFTILIFVSLFS